MQRLRFQALRLILFAATLSAFAGCGTEEIERDAEIQVAEGLDIRENYILRDVSEARIPGGEEIRVIRTESEFERKWSRVNGDWGDVPMVRFDSEVVLYIALETNSKRGQIGIAELALEEDSMIVYVRTGPEAAEPLPKRSRGVYLHRQFLRMRDPYVSRIVFRKYYESADAKRRTAIDVIESSCVLD
ncbi:MAG: hypothetical protein NUW37_05470 [Planctomycetes bacterium]|nr:hypothetical protein [Planctomycetota bacterium]